MDEVIAGQVPGCSNACGSALRNATLDARDYRLLSMNTPVSTTLIVALAMAICASTTSAVTVTFYGVGAQSTASTPSTPEGIGFGIFGPQTVHAVNHLQDGKSQFGVGFTTSAVIFTQGADLNPIFNSFSGSFYNGSTTTATEGAVVDGVTKNYALISFDSSPFVHEAVGEFVLDEVGGSYLNALAVNDSGAPLSISLAKIAIDAARVPTAVPEPTNSLALAALVLGLVAMRKRRC